jgi:quinol monooxygenase YgiN
MIGAPRRESRHTSRAGPRSRLDRLMGSEMIVRIWRTRVAAGHFDEYQRFANEFSLPMFVAQHGCRGVLFTSFPGGEAVVSLWSDAAAADALDQSPRYQEVAAKLSATGWLCGEATVERLAVHGGWIRDGAASSSGFDITVQPGELAVCRLAADSPAPAWATGPIVSVTRAGTELSVICDATAVPPEIGREAPYRALKVAGPLDFRLTGVLASIAGPLAAAGVPILAVATYDTDYVLVRAAELDTACRALRAAGHRINSTSSAP